MYKIYEVFVQDIWNNNYWIGMFTALDDALDGINSYIYNPTLKLKKGDLQEYPSTFNYCFDKDIYDEDSEDSIYVRGFIHCFVKEEDYRECIRLFVDTGKENEDEKLWY